jgi:uncharacterized protein with LGFP repeats
MNNFAVAKGKRSFNTGSRNAKNSPTFGLLALPHEAEQQINVKHLQLGGDSGVLGPAMEDVQASPDGFGFFRHYKNGIIYWSPETNAQ